MTVLTQRRLVVDEHSKDVEKQRSAGWLQAEGFHHILVRGDNLRAEIRARLLWSSRVAGEPENIGPPLDLPLIRSTPIPDGNDVQSTHSRL